MNTDATPDHKTADLIRREFYCTLRVIVKSLTAVLMASAATLDARTSNWAHATAMTLGAIFWLVAGFYEKPKHE